MVYFPKIINGIKITTWIVVETTKKDGYLVKLVNLYVMIIYPRSGGRPKFFRIHTLYQKMLQSFFVISTKGA